VWCGWWVFCVVFFVCVLGFWGREKERGKERKKRKREREKGDRDRKREKRRERASATERHGDKVCVCDFV